MAHVTIPPLRPYMQVTDSQGIITKDAYAFLDLVFKRIGETPDKLNAMFLEDATWEAPLEIGATTPNKATFTDLRSNTLTVTGLSTLNQLTATGTVNFSSPSQIVTITPTGTGTVVIKPDTQGSINNVSIGSLQPRYGGFSTLQSTGAFGCNGKAPQAAYSVGGAVSTAGATNTTPYGFTTAAQANDIIAKLNAVITALTNNGITI